MAARLKPRHQDDIRKKPFYVYEIYDDNKNVIYVGKGTKYKGLLNKAKGGNGGRVLKGDKDSRLMQEIGTRAFAARLLLGYYNTFKNLTSTVDKYYTKELQDIFNNLDIEKLRKVGYAAA